MLEELLQGGSGLGRCGLLCNGFSLGFRTVTPLGLVQTVHMEPDWHFPFAMSQ